MQSVNIQNSQVPETYWSCIIQIDIACAEELQNVNINM